MKHKTNSINEIVAITGGSGFVGTNVPKLLSSKGYEIVNYDLVEPTKIVNNETYVKCDITDVSQLSVRWRDVDYVIHLAALVGVTECQASPPFSTLINFIGTQNICEVVRKQNRSCSIVFAGSSAVYGDPGSDYPTMTEFTPLSPLSFYGLQKMWSENILKQYAKDFGMRSTALRFFNIFGTGQNIHHPILESFQNSVIV